MKTIGVAFAGGAGSGKSTLASRAASILNWPQTSFGDYIRRIAAERGLAGTRNELQDIGAELIDQKGWAGFCRDVLSFSDWRPGSSLIVDGLRHPPIYNALREILAPMDVIIIFVKADELTRTARLRERGEVHPDGAREIDLHPVEKQIGELPNLAALTVDGTGKDEVLTDDIVEYLTSFCELPPLRATISHGYQIRIPRSLREKLQLHPGQILEFDQAANCLKAEMAVDPARIKSVFGALKSELKDVETEEWLNTVRGPVDLPKERK